MSSTYRLFAIIQRLRVAKRPVLAVELSEVLEVSVRTIYRDIAQLQSQHVPIFGEAGIGYIMKKGYDMPPLMLNADEVDAIILGAHWVAQRGDPSLSISAQSLLDKIQDVIPGHMRSEVLSPRIVAPNVHKIVPDHLDMQALREAIRNTNKIKLSYSKVTEENSERLVWPFMMAYFDTTRLLVAWCELRQDFRHFRTDRITKMEILTELYPKNPKLLRMEWEADKRNLNKKQL